MSEVTMIPRPADYRDIAVDDSAKLCKSIEKTMRTACKPGFSDPLDYVLVELSRRVKASAKVLKEQGFGYD